MTDFTSRQVFCAGEDRPFVQRNFALTMNELITEAHINLKNYLQIENKVPFQLLQQCKGIMLASLMKNGIGTGIIMTRNDITKEWNGPCAISINYMLSGIQFPGEKIDYLLLINDDKIISLSAKNYLQLGIDIPLIIGMDIANCHEHDIHLNAKEQKIKPLLMYLLTKEVTCIHMTLNGAMLIIDEECNEQYYQKPVQAFDILSGNVIFVCDAKYVELCRMLNDYIAGYHLINGNNNDIYIEQRDNEEEWKLKKQMEQDFAKLHHPLYQYYNNGANEFVTFLQLSQLGVFPFANDIKNRKQTSIIHSPWHFGKKIFQQIKNFWQIGDNHITTNDISSDALQNEENKKFWLDQNIPLCQYYAGKNDTIKLNKDQLSNLPKFPFLNDIKNHKGVVVLRDHTSTKFANHFNKNHYNDNRNHNSDHIHDHTHNHNHNHNHAMEHEQKFEFNEIIPLYQYYAFDRMIYYDYKTLSRLPIIPYLQSIKNNEHLSTEQNAIYNIHLYYSNIKQTCENTKIRLNNYNSN